MAKQTAKKTSEKRNPARPKAKKRSATGSATSQLEKARAAKREALRVFSEIGEVNGIGLTRKGGRYVVRVNLARELDDTVAWPKTIAGVPVVLRIVGPIKKQPSRGRPAARKRSQREDN